MAEDGLRTVGWRVGYASASITPTGAEGPLYLAGYGQRRAEAVRDELEAHAIALQWGTEAAVAVSLDLLGLMRPDTAEVQRCVREALAEPDLTVLVCCTHTHAAPDLVGLWGPEPGDTGVNPAYRERVRAAAAAAAVTAWGRRRDATLWAAQASVEGVAYNARDPGLLDPLLTNLSWRAADGSTVARVLHFACHPEALGGEDRRISADLAGAARRLVSALRGGPCLWWPGALGGMVTPLRLEGETGEAALVRLGLRLGEAAVELAAAEQPVCGGLAVRRLDVDLPLDNPRFQAAARAGVLARAPVEGPAGPTVRSCAGLLLLGPYLWLLAPGEVLPGLAREWMRLCATAPAAPPGGWPGGVLGLCDDEIGYILPPSSFTPGRYEESMSLGRDTAFRLTDAYRTLLGTLGSMCGE